MYITFVFYFLVIMFRLHCWFDKKTGIVFNCDFSFTTDQIWARPNKCAQNRYKYFQNRYTDVKNSLYQPSACFLVQDFIYSIESIEEIIFHIFKLKK